MHFSDVIIPIEYWTISLTTEDWYYYRIKVYSQLLSWLPETCTTHLLKSPITEHTNMPTGSCYCGKVRIEYTGEPELTVIVVTLIPIETTADSHLGHLPLLQLSPLHRQHVQCQLCHSK